MPPGTDPLGNRGWLSALALGLPALLVVLGVGIAVTCTDPTQQLTFAAAACSEPPTFKLGHNPGGVNASQQGAGFKLSSEAWVETNLCSAGTLNISASGELGGDELPQLTVYLNAELLAVLPFNQQQTIPVKVPRPGRIILGFFNDYYLADVRVASLDQIKLDTPGCKDFDVEVPPESAGNWYPQPHIATLVRDPPMILKPCAAGELSMRLRGREGNGAFPNLVFRQGGRTIKTAKTGEDWQPVSLKITSAPLTVSVSNPYGKTLANRNLKVENLSFSATR